MTFDEAMALVDAGRSVRFSGTPRGWVVRLVPGHGRCIVNPADGSARHWRFFELESEMQATDWRLVEERV